jgi:hypothetical protein
LCDAVLRTPVLNRGRDAHCCKLAQPDQARLLRVQFQCGLCQPLAYHLKALGVFFVLEANNNIVSVSHVDSQWR